MHASGTQVRPFCCHMVVIFLCVLQLALLLLLLRQPAGLHATQSLLTWYKRRRTAEHDWGCYGQRILSALGDHMNHEGWGVICVQVSLARAVSVACCMAR